VTTIRREIPILVRADALERVLPERYRVGRRFLDRGTGIRVEVVAVVAERDHVRVDMIEAR
jgi:hypothetical protein